VAAAVVALGKQRREKRGGSGRDDRQARRRWKKKRKKLDPYLPLPKKNLNLEKIKKAGACCSDAAASQPLQPPDASQPAAAPRCRLSLLAEKRSGVRRSPLRQRPPPLRRRRRRRQPPRCLLLRCLLLLLPLRPPILRGEISSSKIIIAPSTRRSASPRRPSALRPTPLAGSRSRRPTRGGTSSSRASSRRSRCSAAFPRG